MKKLNRKNAKARAWQQFSLWVRLSVSDSMGLVRCITCRNKKHYKMMQSGHFIPGRSNAVLFSEEGVHPQCYGCNIGKNGNWPEYYEYMKTMYGLEVIERLLLESHRIVKYTVQDYVDIENKYKNKLRELKINEN